MPIQLALMGTFHLCLRVGFKSRVSFSSLCGILEHNLPCKITTEPTTGFRNLNRSCVHRAVSKETDYFFVEILISSLLWLFDNPKIAYAPLLS